MHAPTNTDILFELKFISSMALFAKLLKHGGFYVRVADELTQAATW